MLGISGGRHLFNVLYVLYAVRDLRNIKQRLLVHSSKLRLSNLLNEYRDRVLVANVLYVLSF